MGGKTAKKKTGLLSALLIQRALQITTRARTGPPDERSHTKRVAGPVMFVNARSALEAGEARRAAGGRTGRRPDCRLFAALFFVVLLLL